MIFLNIYRAYNMYEFNDEFKYSNILHLEQNNKGNIKIIR